MACPHVSGIAALIVSKFAAPGFTPDQVWAHLTKRTRAIGLYNPSYLNKLGSGLADAYMALARRPGNSPGKSTPARMQPDSRGYGRYLARIGR